MTKQEIIDYINANKTSANNLELLTVNTQNQSQIDIRAVIGSKEDTIEFITVVFDDDLISKEEGKPFQIKAYSIK